MTHKPPSSSSGAGPESAAVVPSPLDDAVLLNEAHELLKFYLTHGDWLLGEPTAYFAKLNAAIAAKGSTNG